MQIITAGKVALTSGAALQVSALTGMTGYRFVHKLVVRASDTQSGSVYIGPSTVTNVGANAYGAVIKPATTGQTDFLEIEGFGEDDVDLTSVYLISGGATDSCFVYAFVE